MSKERDYKNGDYYFWKDEDGDITLRFSIEGFGFGGIELYDDGEGRMFADVEAMAPSTCGKIFEAAIAHMDDENGKGLPILPHPFDLETPVTDKGPE